MPVATTPVSIRLTRIAWVALGFVASVTTPAFAAPGVDLSANHICPGVAGASSDGGFLDCVALSNSGGFAEVFATFKAAEAIPDLSNLDGRVDVEIVGTWNTNGQFWDTSAGACLDNNGAAPGANTFIGSKPATNCGTVTSIRPAFTTSAQTTIINSPNVLSMYFTVYTYTPISITTAERIFGFQIRYDPVYAAENGTFNCGTCATPVCWRLRHAQPGSLSQQPTTILGTSTGEAAGCRAEALYNAGCIDDPVRPRTWGQLKSLYR